MNADYVNIFIQGAQNTLSAICGENASLGKVFIKAKPIKSEEISVIIGIIGQLTGNVVFAMKKQTALDVGSTMFGMTLSVFDEMAQSAISEISNMISGQIATIFSGRQIVIDITCPRLIENALPGDFDFVENGKNLICIPLIFVNKNIFEVDVYL